MDISVKINNNAKTYIFVVHSTLFDAPSITVQESGIAQSNKALNFGLGVIWTKM